MIGMTVCSGIGAPEVAAPWIDWKFQSEIEPFPSAVLAKRFPDAVNLGDMTKFQEWPNAAINVLCGGTPCQSFSVAGLRQGLADPRGNLMLTYLAIAARYRPRWLVWENVPGVLSSLSHDAPDPCPPGIDLDGDDGPEDGEEVVVADEYDAEENHALLCFLAGAAELGYCGGFVTIDAQHTCTPGFPRAVPQRRERVFFAGYLGDWTRAAAVLFDTQSLRGDPAPRREAGKAAPTLPGRSTGGGGLGTDFDLDGGLIPSHDPAVTLTARDRKGPPPEADLSTVIAIQERAVSENPSSGPGGIGVRTDGAAYTLEARHRPQAVAHALTGEGFDGSEDGTGRGTPIVPIAFDCKGTQVQTSEDGAALTLRSMGHHHSHANAGGHAAVAFDTTQITSPKNFSNPKPGDPCHPLASGAHAPAVAFDMRGRDGGAQLEGPHDTANIRAASGGSSRSYVALPWAVRRLTPTECERLMGFPDGWTQIEWRGKPADQCPDGHRYKALGNSWAVNCGQWIFDNIQRVEELTA